jgi:hypothetical protein
MRRKHTDLDTCPVCRGAIYSGSGITLTSGERLHYDCWQARIEGKPVRKRRQPRRKTQSNLFSEE